MAKARRNRNKKNTSKHNVFVASSSVFLVFILVIVFFIAGIMVRRENSTLESKIKEAENNHIELLSNLRTEEANLNSKINIKEIQKALRKHGIAMDHVNKNRKYTVRMDRNKSIAASESRSVAYNFK